MNLGQAIAILRAGLRDHEKADVMVSTSDGQRGTKAYGRPFAVTIAGPSPASATEGGHVMGIGMSYGALIALRKQIDDLIHNHRPLPKDDE